MLNIRDGKYCPAVLKIDLRSDRGHPPIYKMNSYSVKACWGYDNAYSVATSFSLKAQSILDKIIDLPNRSSRPVALLSPASLEGQISNVSAKKLTAVPEF